MLDEEYSIDALLESWTGPDFNDKDFRFGSFGIEVKLTSSKVPKVKISSERQLDNENLTKLYLVLINNNTQIDRVKLIPIQSINRPDVTSYFKCDFNL